MTTYDTKDLVSVTQAAGILGISRQRIHQLIKAKKLVSAVVLNRQHYFNKQELVTWKLERQLRRNVCL